MKKTTKLQKRTLKLIDEINNIIEENPVDNITLRQIWYRLLSKHILKSCDSDYLKLSRTAVKGRKNGLIPLDTIIDPDRKRVLEIYHYQTPKDFFNYKKSYDSLKKYFTSYYVHKWHKQPNYIEIWTEKEALSTLFEPIAFSHDVSYIVCKGFASYTILIEASKRIKEECTKREKDRATILYFGDYDPSGKRIAEVIQKELKILNNDTSINFVEIALNSQQIRQYDLPLIPLKKKDKNYKWFMENFGEFENFGCELDALEPLVFQDLVEKTILDHFDETIFLQVEKERQEEIKKMVVATEKLLSKLGVE